MTYWTDGNYWVTPPILAPVTPTDEFQQATGIRLSHAFVGDSLVDTEGGVVLAPVGAPTIDNPVTNTLDGAPLITDPPSKIWSHSYRYTLTTQAHQAASPSAIDFGTQSFMVSATVRFGVQGAPAALCGNRDMSLEGFEIKYDTASNKLQFAAQPVSGGAVITEFVEAMETGTLWYEVCAIVDRSAGLIRLGTVANESSAAIGVGSLTSALPFSIGKGRLPAIIGDTMGVRVAFGSQVEGRSPKLIAQSVAPLIWFSRTFERVVSTAK